MSVPVIVDARGWDAYFAAVQDSSVRAIAEGVVEMLEQTVVPIVKADSPVRTGRLQRSYYGEVGISNAGSGDAPIVFGKLKSTAPYARIIQFRRHHETPGVFAGTDHLPALVNAHLELAQTDPFAIALPAAAPTGPGVVVTETAS